MFRYTEQTENGIIRLYDTKNDICIGEIIPHLNRFMAVPFFNSKRKSLFLRIETAKGYLSAVYFNPPNKKKINQNSKQLNLKL